MFSLTSDWICYIEYDQIKKTYLLSGTSWDKLDQRALIREWVKLIPWWVIAYQGKQENKKSIENKNKKIAEQSNILDKSIDELKKDPKRWKIINFIPSSLKDELEKDVDMYKSFLSKTEKRLDEIIKDAKSKNRELHTEPISKVWVHKDGLMEVHLINWTTEKDVIFRNNGSHLWYQGLYNILDGEESWYKQYLTARILQKRSEYDYLTKEENIISTNKEVKKEDLASTQEKTNAIYGLWLMWKLVDNIRDDEWNTRANTNDRKIIDMVKYLRDAQYTIKTNENVSKFDLQTISSNISNLYRSYALNKGNRSMSHNNIMTYGKALISWPKDKSIEAIRKMWEWLTNFDNTHTKFLRDEIIENDDLEIKEIEYNTCFQKIWEILSIPEWEWEMPANIKANIDELYAASTSAPWVLNFLKSKGMLPSSASLDDKKINEWCKKIYNTIQSKNQIIDHFDIKAEDMKQSLQEEKNNLEAKDNKTSDDIARLNAILFLLGNPDALQEQAEKQKEVMADVIKYVWIDSEIKWSIWSRLIKKWWWASGTNADIYNDSIGAWWWFERSDENVSKTSEIMKQIAIEVAICVVAIAAWAFTFWAGTAAIYWARAAMIASRVVSAASKWWKILKIMKLASRFANYKKYYKAGKAISKALEVSAKARKVEQIALATNKITKIGKIINPFVYAPELWKWIQTLARWTALVLEWTTFHLSSTVLHNAVNGKMDLFEWTDPTGYMVLPDWTQMSNRKSYAQSIAFLWVLKAVGQPVQQLTKALLAKIMSQKATASMMWKAVQSMWSFTWEVWTLMWTEQVLGLTFDQRLSPLTWDWFIHTIGMVAWLRGYTMLKQKGQLMVKDYKQSSDGKSIELLTLEVTRDGKPYETVLNSKWEVVRTTDPMLRQWMEVKVDQYGSRSEILNRAPANRNNTADYIAKNRYENWNNKTNEGVPTEVQIRTWEKVKIDHNWKYKDIIDQYKDLIQKNKENPNLDITSELSKLDMQLAERITLDKWKSIEYTSEAEARLSFEQLSKMKEYDSTLRTYKNFEWKRCVEKLSSNTIMPNIYISVKWMEWRRWVDYTWATIKNFEIPINNLQPWDQIFTEFGSKRYEFAKKENGNWEVISQWGRFEKWDEIKLNKNGDWTMTFERIIDARKMEVSEIWLKKFASSQSEVIMKDVIDSKQIEDLVENFDVKIMSVEGIAIDGKNYKMIYEPNMTQNKNKKWTWKFIVDGKVETSVQAETMVLPENSNGNRIREKYYELRDKYVNAEVIKSGKDIKIEEREQKEKEQKEKEQREKEQREKEPIQIKYIDKPLKENFTDIEWTQFKDELLFKIKEKYPDWYQEVIGQWYRLEHFEKNMWGITSATDKIIYINPRMMGISPPWSKAKGAEIPIETMLHEMSHIITEKNLELDLLYLAKKENGNYRMLENIANNEQQLFMKLADIYGKTEKTFSKHANSDVYKNPTEVENEADRKIWAEILPVREDMVELNAKYQRGELETYLNKRGKEMWVNQKDINSILQGFKDINGSKVNKDKIKEKKETEEKLKKEAEEKLKKEAEKEPIVAEIQENRGADNKESDKKNTVWAVELTEQEIMDFNKEAPDIAWVLTEGLPKTKINIWWKEIYISEMLNDAGRWICLWYIKVWNTFKTRLFYFSQSGWNRHSTPKITIDINPKTWKVEIWKFSKGEMVENLSYEKGTVVVGELQEYLNKKLREEHNTDKELSENTVKYLKRVSKQNQQDFISEISNNTDFLDNKTEVNKFLEIDKRLNKEEVKDIYKNLKLPEWLSIENIVKNGNNRSHAYLWDVQSEIMVGELNGKKIQIEIAHAVNQPNLFWVENISYAQKDISSFLIDANQIAWWLFTNKPLEYETQVPKSLKEDSELKHWEQYIDIREVTQDNPLIKMYKEMKQSQRETPQELLNIEWKEFTSELWRIEDLDNIGNYKIVKIETNDWWRYELKPLGKWAYEIITSNSKVPKWEIVWILAEKWSIHFPMIYWNEISWAVKDIRKVNILTPTGTERAATSWYDNVVLIKNNRGEGKSKIDPKTVEANAKLSDADRLTKAKELLWRITVTQEQAIVQAHNQPGEINNLNLSQIRARVEILQKAGFTSEQIRTLMENGICWSYGEREGNDYEYDIDEWSFYATWEMSETNIRLDEWIGYAFDADTFREGMVMKINIWRSELEVTKVGDEYMISIPDTNEMFFLLKWTKLTIWRSWDIQMIWDNTISSTHATVECDMDGNFILQDMSLNWTQYRFDMSGNQNENSRQQDQGQYEKMEKKIVKFPDWSEVDEAYACVILWIPYWSAKEDAKKAYRQIALKNHPDRNQGDKEKEEKFKWATSAYERYLSNR